MENNNSDTRFESAVKVVMDHEDKTGKGKITKDSGGVTKYGISLRFLKLAGLDLNMDGVIDAYDILSLSPEKSKEVYKEYWWDKYKYNNIDDLSVATKIFDLSVNMGPVQAHKIAQRALNNLTPNNPYSVNGILGPKTLLAINSSNPMHLLASIKKEASKYYIHLSEIKPEFRKELNGWLTRAND